MEKNTPKTKKEQRALSDARLLESAISLFGENGYDNTSLVQIAKGAGVTSGLIVQRYETKENLLLEAWKRVVVNSFSDEEAFLIVPAGLNKIIDCYRELYKRNYSYFRFLKMLLNRQSLPDSFNQKSDEVFAQRQNYHSLVEAQKEKRIIEGDPHELFRAFIQQVVSQIEISELYGVPFPDYDFFVRIFQIQDDDNLTRVEQKEKMVKSFVDGFDSISYIYVKENRIENLTISKSIIDLVDKNDAIGSFRRATEKMVHKDYQKAVCEFFDFERLNVVLRDTNMVHFSSKTINGNDIVHVISVVERDSEGNIAELLLTVHCN